MPHTSVRDPYTRLKPISEHTWLRAQQPLGALIEQSKRMACLPQQAYTPTLVCLSNVACRMYGHVRRLVHTHVHSRALFSLLVKHLCACV